MVKSQCKNGAKVAAKRHGNAKREVEVIVAPDAFPNFTKSFGSFTGSNNGVPSVARRLEKRSAAASEQRASEQAGPIMNFGQALKEVHAMGSTLFSGAQKRRHEDELYKTLTGREKPKQKVPLKIVRRIRNAALRRQQTAETEARESGLVTASGTLGNNNNNSNKKVAAREQREEIKRAKMSHGPAPGVGYMKGGVLHLKKDFRP